MAIEGCIEQKKAFFNLEIALEVLKMSGKVFFRVVSVAFTSIIGMVFLVADASPESVSKLVVKDDSGSQVFSVASDGNVYTAQYYLAQGLFPGIWLDETGSGNKGAFFVLDSNWFQIQRRAQGFGAYEASPFFMNIGAPSLSISVGENGYIGFGVSAAYPLHMGSGAYCSSGGVWTNASSREYKKDIRALTGDEAMDALKGLRPVKFRYKAEMDETHVGFIAEEVPDLVATKDRKGMSSMDVVGVLTRVVQEQQKTIAQLSKKVAELENRRK